MKVEKYWTKHGYWFDVNSDDGYIRISDREFDLPGATVIILDAFGAFEIYKLDDRCRKTFVNLDYQQNLIVSEGLVRTWKELEVDFITKCFYQKNSNDQAG